MVLARHEATPDGVQVAWFRDAPFVGVTSSSAGRTGSPSERGARVTADDLPGRRFRQVRDPDAGLRPARVLRQGGTPDDLVKHPLGRLHSLLRLESGASGPVGGKVEAGTVGGAGLGGEGGHPAGEHQPELDRAAGGGL
jgi:hypothetical protein